VSEERGPYRTLADVLAACTPGRRQAVDATLQFICESVEARYSDWPDPRAAELVVRAVNDQADVLRSYLDQVTPLPRSPVSGRQS
jgi:hypothetical protein